jgi:hypothetical protein
MHETTWSLRELDCSFAWQGGLSATAFGHVSYQKKLKPKRGQSVEAITIVMAGAKPKEYGKRTKRFTLPNSLSSKLNIATIQF